MGKKTARKQQQRNRNRQQQQQQKESLNRKSNKNKFDNVNGGDQLASQFSSISLNDVTLSIRPAGLPNLGNTCYFNSVLQVLGQTYILHETLTERCRADFIWNAKTFYIKEKGGKSYFASENLQSKLAAPNLLINSFLQVQRDIFQQKSPNPRSLLGGIRREWHQFQGYNEQDSQELFISLVDCLKKSEKGRQIKALLQGLNIDDPKNASKEDKAKANRYGITAKHTVLDAIFGGQLLSIIHCTVCNYRSFNFEPFIDLSLPLDRHTSNSVDILQSNNSNQKKKSNNSGSNNKKNQNKKKQTNNDNSESEPEFNEYNVVKEDEEEENDDTKMTPRERKKKRQQKKTARREAKKLLRNQAQKDQQEDDEVVEKMEEEEVAQETNGNLDDNPIAVSVKEKDTPEESKEYPDDNSIAVSVKEEDTPIESKENPDDNPSVSVKEEDTSIESKENPDDNPTVSVKEEDTPEESNDNPTAHSVKEEDTPEESNDNPTAHSVKEEDTPNEMNNNPSASVKEEDTPNEMNDNPSASVKEEDTPEELNDNLTASVKKEDTLNKLNDNPIAASVKKENTLNKLNDNPIAASVKEEDTPEESSDNPSASVKEEDTPNEMNDNPSASVKEEDTPNEMNDNPTASVKDKDTLNEMNDNPSASVKEEDTPNEMNDNPGSVSIKEEDTPEESNDNLSDNVGNPTVSVKEDIKPEPDLHRQNQSCEIDHDDSSCLINDIPECEVIVANGDGGESSSDSMNDNSDNSDDGSDSDDNGDISGTLSHIDEQFRLKFYDYVHQTISSYRDPMFSDNNKDLGTLFQNFIKEEALDGANKYLCESCIKKNGNRKCYSKAIRSQVIALPPPVLVLHLKRFETSGGGGRRMAQSMHKLNTQISFPEKLNLSPYTSRIYEYFSRFYEPDCDPALVSDQNESPLEYTLYGVVLHSGSLRSGHYTAYVSVRPGQFRDSRGSVGRFLHLKPFVANIEHILSVHHDELQQQQITSNGAPEVDVETETISGEDSGSKSNDVCTKWYHVSDSSVSPITLEAVLRDTTRPYLLFYERTN